MLLRLMLTAANAELYYRQVVEFAVLETNHYMWTVPTLAYLTQEVVLLYVVIFLNTHTDQSV